MWWNYKNGWVPKPKKIARVSVTSLDQSKDERSENTQKFSEYDNIVGINIPLPRKVNKGVLQEIKEYLQTLPHGQCNVHLLVNPYTYEAKCIDTKIQINFSPGVLDNLKGIIHSLDNQ